MKNFLNSPKKRAKQAEPLFVALSCVISLIALVVSFQTARNQSKELVLNMTDLMPTLTIQSNIAKSEQPSMSKTTDGAIISIQRRNFVDAYNGITISNLGNKVSNVKIEPFCLVSTTHIDEADPEMNFRQVDRIHMLLSTEKGDLIAGDSISIKPVDFAISDEWALSEFLYNNFMKGKMVEANFAFDEASDKLLVSDMLIRPTNFNQIAKIDEKKTPYYGLCISKYEANEGKSSSVINTGNDLYAPVTDLLDLTDYYSCDLYLLLKIEYDVLLSDSSFIHKTEYFEGRDFDFFSIAENEIDLIYKPFF